MLNDNEFRTTHPQHTYNTPTICLQPPSDFIRVFFNNTKVYNGKNSNSNDG